MKKFFLIALSFIALNNAFAQTKDAAVNSTMNERYEVAAADFKKLIATEPANGDYYFLAGDNYFYWGELDSAESMFRKGQEVAPLNPLNYVGLGRIGWFQKNESLAKGQYTKAIEIMDTKSNKIDKNTKQLAYIKMAETYVNYDNKNLPEAEILLNKAIPLNDKNPEVFVQMGNYLAEKNPTSPSAAVAEFNKALIIDPKYTRALLRKGMLYARVQQASAWEEALKYFNEAIALDANFAPAYREKAELLMKAGRYAEAMEAFGKYYELNPSCRIHQRYGIFIFLAKDYKKAVDEIEQALPCNPDYAYMYRYLGKGYYENGEYQKTIDNLDKFMSLVNAGKGSGAKLVGDDYAYYGKAYNKLGNDSLAIVWLTKAMEIDTSYIAEGNLEIGGIHFKAKRYGAAAESYKARIDHLKSGDLDLDYYYYGQALYFNKEYQKCVDAFANAKRYPDAEFWRGRAAFRLDNPETPAGLANEYYSNFLNYVGEDAKRIETYKKSVIETYSYFGFYYLTKGNFECSKAAWLKVQALDPANEKAAKALTDPELMKATGTCDVANSWKTVTPEEAPKN
jgi:tetratricopeptide (TPR) repeat protein